MSAASERSSVSTVLLRRTRLQMFAVRYLRDRDLPIAGEDLIADIFCEMVRILGAQIPLTLLASGLPGAEVRAPFTGMVRRFVSLNGGSDSLANLRPSCARCNRGWR